MLQPNQDILREWKISQFLLAIFRNTLVIFYILHMAVRIGTRQSITSFEWVCGLQTIQFSSKWRERSSSNRSHLFRSHFYFKEFGFSVYPLRSFPGWETYFNCVYSIRIRNRYVAANALWKRFDEVPSDLIIHWYYAISLSYRLKKLHTI